MLALDTRKSMPQSATGISTPPKEDMASTMNVLPASRTTLPTDWISLRIPLVVSLWTMAHGDRGVLGQQLGIWAASGTLS